MACQARGVADHSRPSRVAWRALKSADFAAALTTPAMAKSAHFSLHHIAARPPAASRPQRDAVVPEISTTQAPNRTESVDNIAPSGRFWLGLVVPKRYAPHAVTRNLIKRLMRAQISAQQGRLRPGQWLIRLRAPIDTGKFISAASARLQCAVRSELEFVVDKAASA